jgi:hypothetical protein
LLTILSHGIFYSFRLKFNKLKYGSENIPLEDQKSSSNEAQNFDDGWIFLFKFIYLKEFFR